MIDSSFGSMDEMKSKFEAAGAPGAGFGSGWVWVVVNNAGIFELAVHLTDGVAVEAGLHGQLTSAG